MSSFKRMRLVDENEFRNSQMNRFQTPVEVQQMSKLDSEIQEILSQDIDERTKAKLYSEILRKFLSYKRQYLEDLYASQPSKQTVIPTVIKRKTNKKKKKPQLKTKIKVEKKTPKKTSVKKLRDLNKRLTGELILQSIDPELYNFSPELVRNRKKNISRVKKESDNELIWEELD